MDRTCPRADIKQTIALICTDIGTAAGLRNIDITRRIGSDVAASCTDENVKLHNQHFGLCAKTAHQNSISNVQMYLFTNPGLLDREELFAYLMDAVGRRGTQGGGETQTGHVEEQKDEQLDPFIHEHNEKYRKHYQRIMDQENAKHTLRLQQNKEVLRQLLMPKTLNTRFLLEVNHNISHLLSLLVLEERLHKIRESIITVPTIFNHTTEDLYKLDCLNEQYVHVERCANSILAEALNVFFPPHYACWNKDNPLSHTMQPLLDCYARNDVSSPTDESWHDQMKRAYTMHDYSRLQRAEDILTAMVGKGDNIVPILSEADHRIENDATLLRFIMCVLFVIDVCNKSKRLCKPLSFTRLDHPANIVFHLPSSKHVYDIRQGQMFCHGGYLYIRRPDMHCAGTMLRSKCILSLCLRLCAD